MIETNSIPLEEQNQPMVNDLLPMEFINKNSKLFLAVFVVLSLILICLAVFLFKENRQLKSQLILKNFKNDFSTLATIPIENNTVVTEQSFTVSDKLNFDPSEKFIYQVSMQPGLARVTEEQLAGVSYPAELLNIPATDLLSFNCSDFYRADHEDGFESYDGSVNNTKLANDDLIAYIQQVKNNTGFEVQAFRFCETENDQKYIFYTLFSNLSGVENRGGGGGIGADHYFATIKNGQVSELVAIPSDGAPYSSCSTLLLLTNEVAYLQCGGGDGGFGRKTINAIDLNAKNYRQVIRCDESITSDESGLFSGRNITCS